MKIYFPSYSGFVKATEVFDLARAYTNEWNNGNANNIFDIEESFDTKYDVIVFPLTLEFYLKNKVSRNNLYGHLARMDRYKKPTFIFNSGDRGLRLPSHLRKFKIFVLRQSGYKSKLPLTHLAIPVIREDPFSLVNLNLTILDKQTPIKVGFCGQADDAFWKIVLKQLRLVLIYLLTQSKISKYSQEYSVAVPTVLRANILKKLKSDLRIETDFIRRKRYKAGAARGSRLEQKIWHDFYSNINNNLYTLCVRGTGNFSARFYETLAMGRIPIVLDTDQLWPVPVSEILHTNCVYVPFKSKSQICEILYNYHFSKDKDELRVIQIENRLFWQKYCSREGFEDNFKVYIEEALDRLNSIS